MRAPLRVALACLLVLSALPIFLVREPVGAQGQVSVYMPGLNFPIALAFASDGRIFYAERLTGSIRIINAGGLLLPVPYFTLPNTATAGERGLLGLALDPGFPAIPYVYAYQTYTDTANATVYNRIVRITGNGNTGTGYVVILQMPPLSGATNHNGGVIAFGPDNKLYAVVGENANQALSQNLMSKLGKVLRMNTDGSPPSDNPFFGNASVDNLIFTYGHRNMFGLAFHPFTNRVFVTENGPNCNDEINVLTAGANYGWGTTATCATPPPAPMNTNQDGPNPVLPIFWWGPTICPTNAAIYAGPSFPTWQGDLFLGDCNTGRLHRLHLVPPTYDTVGGVDNILWTAPTSIIEVQQGPDGAIWFTTPSTIYRYWDSGRPPVAAFTASPSPTTVGVPVTFDASTSTDPDGTIASYAWDFGDTTTGSGVLTTHAYGSPGIYNVTLTVMDNESFTDRVTHPADIRAPGAGPQAVFTMTPSPATPGATVTFDGSVSSDPDGTVVAWEWDFGDITTGTGVVATHAYPSSGRYLVVLTVTDNESLTGNATAVLVVNAPPIAAFGVTPPASFPQMAVVFDGTASSDPDGTIVAYAWNFGDAITATGATVAHTYSSHGAFTVTLRVTDDAGATATATRVVPMGNRPPVITSSNPAGNPTRDAGSAQPFSVTATDPDGDILTYTWRVDGQARGGNSSAFDLSGAGPGTYTVNVTVSDGQLADWHEWTVTVTPASPNWAWVAVPILAAVLVVIFVLWRRRRKREATPAST